MITIKVGKCKLCSEIRPLQKHHYIPQRIKKINHYVYICGDCHKRVHPENEIIIKIKGFKKYHESLKKFLKAEHPEAWSAWEPTREEIKKEIKTMMQSQGPQNTKDD